MRDPYEILGVSRSASDAEIRDGFRRLAREHHPDRNPGDPDAQRRFQEINTAYQILSDPTRRARFDQLGATSRIGGQPGPQAGYTNLNDLFADLFGGFVNQQVDSGDIQEVVDLSFEEAALGCSKTRRYERTDHCSACDGSGAAAGTRAPPCTTCGGTGQLQLPQLGFFRLAGARPCPHCQGRGHRIDQPCTSCGGRGLGRRSREVTVNLPPGIENGASQILRGAGNRATPGRPPGDLELVIRVQPHADFRRDGDDIVSDVVVPFTTAALGGDVEVSTLHGQRILKIPTGCQHGTRLRLKGQGVPHRFRSGRGDHLCEVKIGVPRNLSTRAAELVARFEAEGAAAEDGIFERLRGWFGG